LRALQGFGNPTTVACSFEAALSKGLLIRIFQVTHIPNVIYERD